MINTDIVLRENNQLEQKVSSALSFIEKNYLADNTYELIDVKEIKEINDLDFSKSIRLLKLEKFVYEKNEKIINKLSSVYSALHGDKSSVFLLLDSDGKECDLYLGIKNIDNAVQSFNILKSSVRGNFPGTKLNCDYMTEDIENLMENIIPKNPEDGELTSVIGIPSLKNEKNEDFLQGIENLINGMQGKQFSALIIADPISHNQLTLKRKSYEDIYTQLSIFKDTTFNLSKNEAITLTETVGESIGKTYNESTTDTESISEGRSTSTGTNKGGNILQNIKYMITGSESSSKNKGTTSNHSTSHANTESCGESKSTNTSTAEGKTTGSNKSIQYVQQNKTIYNLLDKIDTQFERLKIGENNGLWAVGAYFISPSVQDSAIAANIYNGVLKGSDSGIERTAIRTFNETEDKGKVMDYLDRFSNPMIYVNDGMNAKLDLLTTITTTDELSMQLNIPKKSVAGLEVVEMSSFGRNQKVISKKKSIEVGKMYHLGNISKVESKLDIESLSSHTFVTGSTGSGKSNTIYTLLDELYKKKIKFMVIEPAKGEYKDVFGGREDVEVYGTNKKYTKLLRVNPFSFNDEIHVLEHIDRLIEIFNACWPMYAAMPAILKDAVEKSYKSLGWDLTESINLFGKNMYPDFKLLKNSLESVINSSSFSDEVKSNYSGALVTRVNSLANGLIGQIFNQDELSEEELFDNNVITDLSRIPSMETKSLIMGILFTKLHEYRMSRSTIGNSNLKHVTVLEEAHNLLKKTATSQSQEGANLQGKSVEMLTNAIAEMRTYGEGFIIADQAPGLLDEAVIRNTNTKICLRLPSLSDRELVGRSMNLSDDQIQELARLETGVAAVYQNNWVESVLIKFNYMNNILEYSYKPDTDDKKLMKESLRYLLQNRLPKNEKKVLLENELDIHNFLVKKEINYDAENIPSIDKAIYKLIEGNKIWEIVNAVPSIDISEWNSKCELIINNILNTEDEKFYRMEIINSIIREETLKNEEFQGFHNEWNEFARKVLKG